MKPPTTPAPRPAADVEAARDRIHARFVDAFATLLLRELEAEDEAAAQAAAARRTRRTA